MPAVREDLRTVAIVAHVDHGKTTLVDAMLRQSGSLHRGEDTERIMDSDDQERERGITILAKHTVIRWRDTTVTIVDTPGHADFGGEVERGLALVDGVVLLVDAAEGPLPQTRFVLRKALEAKLPVILVVNKIDRPDAQIEEVVGQVEELFLELDAEDEQLEFPVYYAIGRDGRAGILPDELGDDLSELLDGILAAIPAPAYDPDHPLQAQVGNLDASPYLGRLAISKISHGTLRRGQQVMWVKRDGTEVRAKVGELFKTEGLERVPAEEIGPGEIAAIAGFPDIVLGDTLTDIDDPRPLPPITVDEPSLAMTIGVNTSPLAGRDGDKLTARMIEARLQQELIGNVSLKMEPTERPDTWEVHGRGELQLAVLVENMRREGFEMTVGKPRVLVRTDEDGKREEPQEALTIDVPEEHLGGVTQLLAERKGQMLNMTGHGTGWIRLEYRIPARGLIGMRTEFLTTTRGAGMMHSIFDGWAPWAGEIRSRQSGSMVNDRAGKITGYAVIALQDRGTLFVAVGDEVYEGSVIGENKRAEDLDVNAVRERKVTNIRSSTAEELVKIVPPREMTLDQALEFIADDECVEVTPKFVRLRKQVLDTNQRQKAAKQKKRGDAPA
ncbi:GTP-binding protein TypA/BipA [Patulibacter medicamentivorans]|uniref:Large ribosomal subunit assembly factor BipA n=1 Tax=Patulibacter medicamentivorans TaxID=1097667 RepID=H0E367_9ACTN|nr:translational GTPase TypA [Patulibacter medicamentivorans]EHN11890.1 GTP-binding protein TypA/BipA [Patulibacter medicamentivorans]